MIRYLENLTYQSAHENAIDEADYEGCVDVVVNRLLAIFPSYLIDGGWIEKGATGGDTDARCRRLKVTLTSNSNLFVRLSKAFNFNAINADLFVGSTSFICNTNTSSVYHAGITLNKNGSICTISFLVFDIGTGFVIGQVKERVCLCVTKTNIPGNIYCFCSNGNNSKMYPDVNLYTSFIVPDSLSNSKLGCLVVTNIVYGMTKLTNVHVCGYKTNIGAGEMFKVGNTNFLILAQNVNYVNICVSDEQLMLPDSGATMEFTAYEKAKLDSIEAGANYYQHPDTHPASMISVETDRQFITSVEKLKLSNIAEEATKTESSQTNGNIKINGQEMQVYQLPVLTKNDVGLNNVDNTSDLDKPLSYATTNRFNKFVGVKKTTGFSLSNEVTISSAVVEVDTIIDTFTLTGGSKLHDNSILKPAAKGFMCKLMLNGQTMEAKENGETIELGYIYGHTQSYNDKLEVTRDTATLTRNTKAYTFTGLENIELAESGSEFTTRYMVTLPFNTLVTTIRPGISRADVDYNQYTTVGPDKGYVCNISQSSTANKINFVVASSNSNLNSIAKLQAWLTTASLTIRVPIVETITELTRGSITNLPIMAGMDNKLTIDADNITEYSTLDFILYGTVGELERKIVAKNTAYHATSADTATVAETAKALTEEVDVSISGAFVGTSKFKGDQNLDISIVKNNCQCGYRASKRDNLRYFKVLTATSKLANTTRQYVLDVVKMSTNNELRMGTLAVTCRRGENSAGKPTYSASLNWLYKCAKFDNSMFKLHTYANSDNNVVFELYLDTYTTWDVYAFTVNLETYSGYVVASSATIYNSIVTSSTETTGIVLSEIPTNSTSLLIESTDLPNYSNVLPSCTSTARPSSAVLGQYCFDKTINKIIVYNGTSWIDAMGTIV